MNPRGRPPTAPKAKWNAERARWEVRVSLPTTPAERAEGVDRRRWAPLEGIGEHEVERAHRVARMVADRVRASGIVDASTPETVNEWFKRWADYRENELKLETVRNDRGNFRNHITDMIGMKAMVDVTRGDVEDVRDALDKKIRAGALGWKTGINVFATLRKMFRDACRSKRRDLQVLTVNPCAEVEGTDRGDTKAKQFLWPTMFSAFVACEAVPVEWRRLLTLSVYLYVRPEEMAALEWADVRIDEGIVLVHRALDMRASSRRLKATKTGKPRRVPIEPTLAPLLKAMRDAAGGKGSVITMPPQSQLARVFRDHLAVALEAAKIDARDLFTSDATRNRIDWRRATRDTGITWRAVRGDSPAKIMHAAGHKHIATTMGYVIESDALAGNFGEVFPQLPASLLRPAGVLDSDPGVLGFFTPKTSGNSWAQQDLNL